MMSSRIIDDNIAMLRTWIKTITDGGGFSVTMRLISDKDEEGESWEEDITSEQEDGIKSAITDAIDEGYRFLGIAFTQVVPDVMTITFAKELHDDSPATYALECSNPDGTPIGRHTGTTLLETMETAYEAPEEFTPFLPVGENLDTITGFMSLLFLALMTRREYNA